MSRTAAACSFLLLAGCATSLSTFQPAHVPEKGHVGAELGADVSIPLGTISTTVDAGKTLAKAAKTRTLSAGEQQQLFDAGTNLVLNAPALVQHVGVTYTPFEHWEVGVRYSSKAWRLGIRRQIFRQEERGFDLTIGLGGQRFKYEFPIKDVIDILEHRDFVRWNFDLPIVFGKHGDFYRVWGGPRLMMSRYSTELALHLPPVNGSAAQDLLANAEGSGFFGGVQAGAAVGYRKVFLGVELTVARFFGRATLTANGASRHVDLGSFVIYPGLALLGEF